jgi:hypothetical protein
MERARDELNLRVFNVIFLPLPIAAGARLNLKDGVELPDTFVLLLTPNGATRRHCRVMWRDGLTLGVKFPDQR